MKLWLITQTANEGYDTYDSAVVAAETEEAARSISPDRGPGHDDGWDTKRPAWRRAWCDDPDQVTAKLIGEAADGTLAGTIIVASFNAG